MSESLHFAEHTLQEVALVVMACVYTLRIFWFTRFKAGKERQAATGLADTSKKKGIIYSMLNIVSPWAMESTRNHKVIYAQFAIFHAGVICAIALSFIIPYLPELLQAEWFVIVFQVIIGASFLVGLYRIFRRMSKPVMKAISTPDDYFSLLLITIWFLFATLSVPNKPESGETIYLIYFWLTAFFLIYVPFSKISHYLYYPFTRYYLGKTMGHRGGFPLRGTRNN
jgi:nitrate reductase gamma subunit